MNKYGVKPLTQCVTIGDISRFRSAEILAADKALLEHKLSQEQFACQFQK